MDKMKRNETIVKLITENTPNNGIVWKHNQDEMIVTPKEVVELLKKLYEKAYIEGFSDCLLEDRE